MTSIAFRDGPYGFSLALSLTMRSDMPAPGSGSCERPSVGRNAATAAPAPNNLVNWRREMERVFMIGNLLRPDYSSQNHSGRKTFRRRETVGRDSSSRQIAKPRIDGVSPTGPSTQKRPRTFRFEAAG